MKPPNVVHYFSLQDDTSCFWNLNLYKEFRIFIIFQLSPSMIKNKNIQRRIRKFLVKKVFSKSHHIQLQINRNLKISFKTLKTQFHKIFTVKPILFWNLSLKPVALIQKLSWIFYCPLILLIRPKFLRKFL